MADNRWLDPELDTIFDGNAELAALAHRVRAARPEPPLDPRFEAVLRAQLMREAPAVLGKGRSAARAGRQNTARRGLGSWWRPTRVAWAGAAMGVALAGAAVFTVVSRPLQDHEVTAMSPVAQLHAVSPDNVITVSFSQPMNQATVVAGLHIRPATEVTTAWQGNNLVITPKHHLAGNTPYTVTIDKAAAVASNGQHAAADIRISFGTAPVPPAAPSVPALAPSALGPVGASGVLVPLPDGSVVATSSAAAAQSSAAPSPTGLVTPTLPVPTASASGVPTSSANAAASPAAVPGGELVALSPGGGVTDLGPGATAAALSPNGLELVAAVPSGGDTQVVLVPVTARKNTVLTTLSASVLAVGWRSVDTTLVAETDRVVSVDLQGHVRTVASLPAGTTRVWLAPGGGFAFAGGSGAEGQLIDLTSQATRTLAGSRTAVAFSGDGSTVAWIDSSGSNPRLVTSPVSRDAVDSVPTKQASDTIGDLALDATGARIAFVDTASDGRSTLQVVALPSGTLLATGPAARAPVFGVRGGQLAFITDNTAQVASIGGASTSVVNPLPDGAAAALEAFVAAQVTGDAKTLSALAKPGLDATGSTPHGLTRAYVISETANADGTLGATARLIGDASSNQPLASFADETLTLTPGDRSGYLVSALTVGTLQAEPVGPHVLKVTPSVPGQHLVMRIAFDSDLRASTVPGAVTVTRRGSSSPLTATTVYDADTRTATVTLDVLPGTLVTVNVATSLVDIDGQALAAPFTVDEGGSGL